MTLPNGRVVPLLAFARLSYGIEQPIVWRRDRLPTITVQATILDGTQPATIVAELKPSIEAFSITPPPGFSLATGGAVEESSKSQGPIAAVVPVMLLVMGFLLMVQLQSFGKLALVVSVAPLGLIGVVVALLGSGSPLGFVAIFGILALIGIIIRNSVILVAQIDEFLGQGREAWDAVVEATSHRVRPIYYSSRCKPRHDFNRWRGLLETDGLCHDRRHSCWHRADADLFAGALCRRLSDKAARLRQPTSPKFVTKVVAFHTSIGSTSRTVVAWSSPENDPP